MEPGSPRPCKVWGRAYLTHSPRPSSPAPLPFPSAPTLPSSSNQQVLNGNSTEIALQSLLFCPIVLRQWCSMTLTTQGHCPRIHLSSVHGMTSVPHRVSTARDSRSRCPRFLALPFPGSNLSIGVTAGASPEVTSLSMQLVHC